MQDRHRYSVSQVEAHPAPGQPVRDFRPLNPPQQGHVSRRRVRHARIQDQTHPEVLQDGDQSSGVIRWD
jgi:hypothetical protein